MRTVIYVCAQHIHYMKSHKKEGNKIDIEKQIKKVGTHNGRFHADEVMATAILKEVFDIELVRTRDKEILDKIDLIYDIGNGEFDHHQIEKEYRENGTPYAACGLIWRRFGKEAILSKHPDLQEWELESIFKHTDAYLIEGIDASDNGIKTTENIIPTMCISAIIAGFNPVWDSPKSEDDVFNEAVEFASAVLDNFINQKASAIKAKRYVVEAYNNRIRPEILMLDKSYPWERSLKEIDTNGEVLFVIYPRDGDYLLQTVREYGGIRRDRKSLPKAWAGKREEELGKIVGINDAVFCHTSRFIAGARSLDSILKMADIAISEPEDVVVHGLFKNLRRLLKKRVVIKLQKR